MKQLIKKIIIILDAKFRSYLINSILCFCLLSSVLSPAVAFNIDNAANSISVRAIDAIEGRDKVLKNGVMSKAGYDLAFIFHEHGDYQKKGGFKVLKKEFRSTVKLARIKNEKILIDAVASNDVNALVDELINMGMENISIFGRVVSGYLPISSLDKAAALSVLKTARASYARTMVGDVTSQGDLALLTNDARSISGVDGSGVIVGTLSDSYDCQGGANTDVVSNDLPLGVEVLADEIGCYSGTDEGRAMMQIIHDIAPGAQQKFHSAYNGMAGFANGIIALENAGCKIINDDVIYLAEPMFQDGLISQAINQVKTTGAAYFSSAGNNASKSYEAVFINSGVRGYRARNRRHDFDSGPGTDSLMQITIPANQSVTFVLQWDDPFYSVSGTPGADTDMDFFLYSESGQVLTGSINSNIGGDPVEIFEYTNPNNSATAFQIAIDHVNGPEPQFIKFVYFGSMSIDEYATNSSSSYGHAMAVGGMSVGAARYNQTPFYGVSPPVLESYSSKGGVPILFDLSGNSINEIRQKPDVVAVDGVDTTFFGWDYEGNGFPNFFGTSAAVPHAAAIAALMKSVNPNLVPDDIYAIMKNTAVDMNTTGFDYFSGFGLLHASYALASIDTDFDGIPDIQDNCPTYANFNQENNDNDLLGDVCDSDDDNDGLSDVDEIVFGTNPFLSDTDNDGISDGDEVHIYNMNPTLSDKGDLAPRGMTDQLLNIGDYVVLRKILANEIQPSFLESVLSDMNNDNTVDIKDLLFMENNLLAQ